MPSARPATGVFYHGWRFVQTTIGDHVHALRPGNAGDGPRDRKWTAKLRVLFFGTYETDRVPRITVLQEGFASHGDEVVTCQASLGLTPERRVRILRNPLLLPLLAWRMARAWLKLARRARSLDPPDAVVVGYMGHFDVHLARALFPDVPMVLDHLVFAADTAVDRRARHRLVVAALRRVDAAALRRADLVCLDTDEHRQLLPGGQQALTVPVGAPTAWFVAPPSEPDMDAALKVVFFGLYTPLQGAPVIGRAIALLAERQVRIRFTMVGRGQDRDESRRLAGEDADVTWLDWLPPNDLAELVRNHDVCLGIFGTSPKSGRVVPQKVFQGAAAGCAVVTSDTAPQREALGPAAVYVCPGDPAALADALEALTLEPQRRWSLRHAAYRRADSRYRPYQVVADLRRRLLAVGDLRPHE